MVVSHCHRVDTYYYKSFLWSFDNGGGSKGSAPFICSFLFNFRYQASEGDVHVGGHVSFAAAEVSAA